MDLGFVVGVVLLLAVGFCYGLLAARTYVTSLGWEDADDGVPEGITRTESKFD